jgi:DNA repair exonuclease SbcCD ATPase subunit
LVLLANRSKAFPETLYKRFLEDKASLTVEEKKLLASWLKKQCSEYQDALTELEGHEQYFRACSWAPYCDKAARECGGWTRDKCKYHKNFELPDDFEAVMGRHRKQKNQASLKTHRSKKRELDQGNNTLEQELDATKKELRRVKREKKALEEKMKAAEEKMNKFAADLFGK